MADDTRTFVDRAAAALAAGKKRDVVPPGPHAPAPPPGFRFKVGDQVIDVKGGLIGRVTAAYPGAASGTRVYEIQPANANTVVRLEEQLEPWRGL